MVELSRRDALLAGAAAALVAGCRTPFSGPEQPDNPWTLWYKQAATAWVQALPVGNGRLGAMIFGGVDADRLQLNEDTLWAGGPYDPNNPQALGSLPEVRRLLFAGQYAQASELAAATMMARPLRQMPYQTLGDLFLTFPDMPVFEDYRRELNLEEAVARTTFVSRDITFKREIFASPIDQIIVVRLTASEPGSVAVNVGINTPHQARTSVKANTLIVRGVNGEEFGVPGALKFEAQIAVRASGGSTESQGDRISVRDADSVLLLIAAATSYKRFDDVSGDPKAIVERQLAAAKVKTYERLLRAHLAEHRRLFQRVTIDLGTTDAADLPTDERVRDSMTKDDPHLTALYFQYGRYLLISSSRPGCQPANLQGIWNDSMNPPWGSKYTININTQMNYWPAEPTALGECVEPLIAMVKDLAETGARTARVHYGARGWVVHHNTDLWRATAPIDGVKSGLWPTGGAWLCNHLWDHFDYSRDRRYLADVYPVMKGAAVFFLDTLVEEPGHRWLVISPSLSPENVHPGGVSLCAGPTMDQQIVRDLFSHCIDAAEILGVDVQLREAMTAARARLAPTRMGAKGQLQEWLNDWDLQAPEMQHRHVSHLYGLYPSGQINLHDTPVLASAARRSLEIRGDNATGWGIGWRLNLWARLQDGEHADQLLKLLLGPERTYPNLFDAHPPFQIDGNFGGVSGIAELFMQSYNGAIYLLPALPKRFANGSITGLCARGGFVVDLVWEDGRLENASIRTAVGGSSILRHGKSELPIRLAPGEKIQVEPGGPEGALIIL